MTAKEIVAELRAANALDPREMFLYLANHAHEAYLADGATLLDRTDFTAWLIELSEAFKPMESWQEVNKAPRAFLLTHCPRCGHVHGGEEECEMDCGGERICRCPNGVRA